MYLLNANKEYVMETYDFIKDWIEVAEKITKEKVDESKLTFYYTYGFFIPKKENKEDYYSKMFEENVKMTYTKRFEYELSKLRVNLTMKLGKFMLTNKLDDFIPFEIIKMVKEVTKYKMIMESEYHNNQEVKDSIPEIKEEYTDIIDIITKIYLPNSEPKKFNIDEILDKISEGGIESLTEEEVTFLNKKSNE